MLRRMSIEQSPEQTSADVPSHRQQPTLLEAVAELEAVVAAGDDERFGPALGLVGGLFGPAGPAERRAAGPRLAALLPDAPPFPRAHLAMVVGACVESGADPVACAGPVLAGLRGRQLPVIAHAFAEHLKAALQRLDK